MNLLFGVLLGIAATTAAMTFNQELLVIQEQSSDNIRSKLKKAEIIPQIVADFHPKYILSIQWSSQERAELGNSLKPDHVQNEPTIKVSKIEECYGDEQSKDRLLTVAMTDPDAPSHSDPKWSQFCHWIITGIPKASKNVMSYHAPAPPENTGPHRYVFLAFEAKNGTSKLNLSKPSERKRWGSDRSGNGVAEWAYENGLNPVAANFIYVQNEKQDDI